MHKGTQTVDDDDDMKLAMTTKASALDEEEGCRDSEKAPTHLHVRDDGSRGIRYWSCRKVDCIKNGMVDKFTNTLESNLNSQETPPVLELETSRITSESYLEEQEWFNKGAMLANKSKSRSRCIARKLEPMMNEIILKLVFKSLNVTSLKSCRLVCKLWRDVSMNSWRKKAVLSLTNHRSFPGQLSLLEFNGFVKSDEANMDNFEFTFDILKKPFQNYKFNEVICPTENWLNYQYCLKTFSEQIKFLEIPFTMKETPCELLVNDIILSLPNLCHLRLTFEFDRKADRDYPEENFEISSDAPQHLSLRILEIAGIDWGEDDDGFRTLFDWKRFLRIIPNLETLKIGKFLLPNDSFNPEWLDIIMRGILAMRRCGLPRVKQGRSKVMNLTELDIQPYHVSKFPGSVLRLIRDCRLPLKSLTIKLGQVEANVESVKALLESLSKTLVTLTLITSLNLQLLEIDSSIVFENLEELTVYSGVTWGHTLVESLIAPKLEKLILKPWDEMQPDCGAWFKPKLKPEDLKAIKKVDVDCFKSCDFSESPLVNLEQLHRFECNFAWNIYTSEKTEELGRMMPNLKHLVLPLNPKSFQTVCHSWPKLWTLEILEPEFFEGDEALMEEIQIGDEVITGIPAVDGNKDDSPGIGNITNLKELTDFSIESKSNPILTEKSVIHGFLKLPRLHYLNVAFKEISDATRISLEAHVPYCHISVSTEDNWN